MAKFDCETPGLETVLERMARRVRAAGGWLSPHLVVHERGGDLCLHSGLPPERRDVLASIPKACFLPLGNVKLAVAGDRIVIKSLPRAYGKTRTALLRDMIEVFNLTGKIAAYRENAPRYVFRNDPEMLDRLTAGRKGTGLADRVRAFERRGNADDLLLEYFIRTRNLMFATKEDQLIPFIDFVNHHLLAGTFERHDRPGPGLVVSIRNSKPVAGSDQVFACYGARDAYDTYLTFGFAAAPATHLKSVPCTIRPGEAGVIEVESGGAPKWSKGQAPGPNDLAFYATVVKAKRAGYCRVSRLVIPCTRAPRALRRVLDTLIRGLDPALSAAEIARLVEEAERQVIAANRAFYEDLADYLASREGDYRGNPAFETAREMCAVQLEGLRRYRHNAPA